MGMLDSVTRRYDEADRELGLVIEPRLAVADAEQQ